MKIKVHFTTDETGMSKDEVIILTIAKGAIIFSYCTAHLLYKRVKRLLQLKGIVGTIPYEDYLHIWCIYVE